MTKSRKWVLRIFDAICLLALVLPGLFIVGIAIIFSDYGGPPTPEEQAETTRLLIFGLALIVTGLSFPLRSQKRAIITIVLITVTASLILIFDGGQPDTAALLIFILAVGLPLYFIRKKLARSN